MKKEALQGEGDRQSDRNYRDRTESFIESGRVEGAAQEAKRAYEEDPEEMESAEDAAQMKAAQHFAKSHPDLSSRMVELAAIRDDLKVRMHLAKKEAQDLFATAEEKWSALTGKIAMLKDTTKDSADNIGAASKLLLDELQESYKRLKGSI